MSNMSEAARKRSQTYGERIVKMDLTDHRTGKVYKDCQVLGGEDGVFAVCRQQRPGCNDIIIELSGDDGSWGVSGYYDEAWVEGHIACLRRV